MLGEGQHWHALQPAVSEALPVQQQPLRHRVEEQSKWEEQGSPGEKVRQLPEPGAQPEQPALIEKDEQQ